MANAWEALSQGTMELQEIRKARGPGAKLIMMFFLEKTPGKKPRKTTIFLVISGKIRVFLGFFPGVFFYEFFLEDIIHYEPKNGCCQNWCGCAPFNITFKITINYSFPIANVAPGFMIPKPHSLLKNH